MCEFLAISVTISDFYFKRETLVIGIIRMPGKHNGEHIKEAIEEVINNYEFDKSKLDATVSDEGSAYLRLFKQITSSAAAINH